MALALRRPKRRRSMLSVVSMIDVMMILLFFFMITSSYLNLDMVPALEKSNAPPLAASTSHATSNPAGTLLIGITPSGTARVAGHSLDMAALSSLVHERVAANPLTRVLLFPSGAADLQALISVMDAVTRAGAKRVNVVRIKAEP